MDDQELPAGRALDARVHERVFGQEAYERGEYVPHLPYYSTDLAASWQVAEYLASQGYRVDSHAWIGGTASITLYSPIDDEESFVGDTPAIAICRAALAVARDRVKRDP